MKTPLFSKRHFSSLVAYLLSTLILISGGCKKEETTSNHLEDPFHCEVELFSVPSGSNTSEAKRSYDLILATSVEGDEIHVLDYVFLIESDDQTSFTAIDPVTKDKKEAVLSFNSQFTSISLIDKAREESGITWELTLQGSIITTPLVNRLRDMNGSYVVKADLFNDGFSPLPEIDTVLEASMPVEFRPSRNPDNPVVSIFIGDDGYMAYSVFFSRYKEERSNDSENWNSLLQINADENSMNLLFELSDEDVSGETPVPIQVRKSYQCNR